MRPSHALKLATENFLLLFPPIASQASSVNLSAIWLLKPSHLGDSMLVVHLKKMFILVAAVGGGQQREGERES